MNLTDLSIERGGQYSDHKGQLRGFVTFQGDRGELKLALSPGAIARIIRTISEEAQATSRLAIQQIPMAVADAIDGGLLLENNGSVQIPGDVDVI